jgi:hypothetical protein
MKHVKLLFAPVRYLCIKHEGKIVFNLWLPLLLAIVTIAIDHKLSGGIKLLASGGLVDSFSSLIQILIGFYIAALAAIATFQNATIDELMLGDTPTIREPDVNGLVGIVSLTRRRFLCYLFGYLAFASLALFFVGVLANLLGDQLYLMIGNGVQWIKPLSIFLYSFIFYNIVITTLLGLHFLTYRIHLEEPRRQSNK